MSNPTFTVSYRQNDPMFGGAQNPMGNFRRDQLKDALSCLRWYAHTCLWKNVTWSLKRGRKTIASIARAAA